MSRSEGIPTPDLIGLLKPAFTHEEQMCAKQIQKGYRAVPDRMRRHERLVVTFHGRPDSVLLPYRQVKDLWTLMTAILGEIENRRWAALAQQRLGEPSRETIPLAEATDLIRRGMLDPGAE